MCKYSGEEILKGDKDSLVGLGCPTVKLVSFGKVSQGEFRKSFPETIMDSDFTSFRIS